MSEGMKITAIRLSVVLVALVVWFTFALAREVLPHSPAILSRLPLDSDLGRLHGLAKSGFFQTWEFKVDEWQVASDESRPVLISDEHGVFSRKASGVKLPDSASGFTGEIKISRYPDNGDGESISLTYVKGKLVAKDWTRLPG